jgi:hypothetical protein
MSSIAKEDEARSIYTKTCSEPEGKGTTPDTSLNVSEQQSVNTVSSDPALRTSTNIAVVPGLERSTCVSIQAMSTMKRPNFGHFLKTGKCFFFRSEGSPEYCRWSNSRLNF